MHDVLLRVTTLQALRGGSMISGALGKTSRLCPHTFFVMQIIFAPPPLFGAPPLVPWAAVPMSCLSIHHCRHCEISWHFLQTLWNSCPRHYGYSRHAYSTSCCVAAGPAWGRAFSRVCLFVCWSAL